MNENTAKKLTKQEFVQCVLACQNKRRLKQKRVESQLKADNFGINYARCHKKSRCWKYSYNKTYSRYTSC